MSTKYVVACDGSDASGRALDYAIECAGGVGASIVIAHVLDWSPYSFLTPEELEERHKRRGEEMKRAKSAVADPLAKRVKAKGIAVETVIRYGHVAETLAAIATETGASQMFVGRTGHGALSARVFGSVVGSLAQVAPVPCTIVP